VRGRVVTLSQLTQLLWGEHPFGGPANQSAKLLRKFERNLEALMALLKTRHVTPSLTHSEYPPKRPPLATITPFPPSAGTTWRSKRVCKPNCKPTAQHTTARGITGWDCSYENAKPKRTVSYSAAQDSTRIIELENRCTGNRTVGSNPTLSASTRCCTRCCW